jgi:hypothetical protein
MLAYPVSHVSYRHIDTHTHVCVQPETRKDQTDGDGQTDTDQPHCQVRMNTYIIRIVSSASGPAPSGFILVFGHVLEAGTLRAGTHLKIASDGRTEFVTPALHAAAFGQTRVTRKCTIFWL